MPSRIEFYRKKREDARRKIRRQILTLLFILGGILGFFFADIVRGNYEQIVGKVVGKEHSLFDFDYYISVRFSDGSVLTFDIMYDEWESFTFGQPCAVNELRGYWTEIIWKRNFLGGLSTEVEKPWKNQSFGTSIPSAHTRARTWT